MHLRLPDWTSQISPLLASPPLSPSPGLQGVRANTPNESAAQRSAVQRSATQNRSAERSGAERRSAAQEHKQKHMGKNKQNKNIQTQTTTNMFKLFWTPNEGIISKNINHMGKANNTKTQKQTKMFKLVWLRGPLSQTNLNIFVCCVFLFCLLFPMCCLLSDMIPSFGVRNNLLSFVFCVVPTCLVFLIWYNCCHVLVRPPLARFVLFKFVFD